jgi:anti-sigma regulatory factor (Ser/Thr protein kinase)
MRLADLPAVRAFVADTCARSGVRPEVSDALVLATDEVCANVVLHGYGVNDPGPLAVAVECTGDATRVTITDAGRPFDPASAAAPTLDAPWQERAVGGLGWLLVRQLVDELRYERCSETNRVTLVKLTS